MSEEDKNILAAMFGDAAPSAKTDEPKAEEPKDTAPEAEPEESADTEDPKAEEVKKEKPKTTKKFPEKDLGVGGAGFAQMIVEGVLNGTLPASIGEKIKKREKTVQGCWNYVYREAYNAYINAHGKKSGGLFMDCRDLIVKYFDEVDEGFVAPEAEKTDIPKPAAAVETVKKVAKKAAKAAKKTKDAVVGGPGKKDAEKKPEIDESDFSMLYGG